jgi:hypothetical protein
MSSSPRRVSIDQVWQQNPGSDLSQISGNGDLVEQGNHEMIALFQEKIEPLQAQLSLLGFAGQGCVNDGGAALRTGLMLAETPYFDNLMVGVSGWTTVSHGPLGIRNGYNAWKEAQAAGAVGDKNGKRLALLDCATSGAQAGLGIGYGGIRVLSIESALQPGSVSELTSKWWNIGGNLGGALLYFGLALSNMLLWLSGRRIGKKFRDPGQRKHEADKVNDINYLKSRLGLDLERMEDKVSKISREEKQEIARQHIREQAKKHLKIVQKSNSLSKTDYALFTKNVADKCSSLSAEMLENLGREILVARLAQKKQRKMTRLFGKEGVKALTEALALDSDISSDKINKLALSHLDQVQMQRLFRICLYTLGVLAMTGFCLFTSGVPLIIFLSIYLFVAVGETYLSLCNLRMHRNAEGMPGRYDTIISYAGIAFTLATMGGIFFVGAAPVSIAIFFILSSIYLIFYICNLQVIAERKQKHCEHLISLRREGKSLTLEEEEYVLTNLTDTELCKNWDLVTSLQGDEKESYRALLLRDCKQRQATGIQEYVQKLRELYAGGSLLAAEASDKDESPSRNNNIDLGPSSKEHPLGSQSLPNSFNPESPITAAIIQSSTA